MAAERPSPKAGPSPFKGHARRGKRHVPPLLDLPIDLTMRPFRKQAFPDFLWLMTMLRSYPLAESGFPTTAALDAGQAATHRAHARGAIAGTQEPVFHGLLTDWERLPEVERGELLSDLQGKGIYEMVAPEPLVHILAAYDDAPGRWLIQPRIDAGLAPERIKAEEHLWETMRLGGSSHLELATHAIFAWLRGLVMMERIHWYRGDMTMALVPRYPNQLDEEQRKAVESAVRATYLSTIGASGETSESTAWCERFWRANRQLFQCIVPIRDEQEPPDRQIVASRAADMFRLHYRFLRAADEVDLDLWDHDRYDVLIGIAWRVLRISAHLVSHPAMWSEEHGYPSIRGLFESHVHMKWMLAVEGDRQGIWHEFKNYGRGRNKALLLHTQEVLERSTGEPREILEQLLPKLQEQANRDILEDFQDITLSGAFAADTSLQAMARVVGLEDMYHSVMIPASSALHGDWSALDEYVLDRCQHALHDRHAVPRLDFHSESLDQVPFLAEHIATWTFDAFCGAFGYQPISDDAAESEMTAYGSDEAGGG